MKKIIKILLKINIGLSNTYGIFLHYISASIV